MVIDYNRKMQFPTNDNFVCRVTLAEFVEAKSSGNPQIHMKFEVQSPSEVEIAGKQVNISGVEVDRYYPVTCLKEKDGEIDADKTAAARERMAELYEQLGLDFSKFDPANPDVKSMQGKVVLCAMSCGSEPQRKTPTAEQAAKGQRQGDIMVNPVTGKQMVYFKPFISEIFGLAPAQTGGASY